MTIACLAKSECLIAISCAMSPPIDQPSTEALSIPRLRAKATASSAAAPSVTGTSPLELETPALSKRMTR
jgi:hypothetical protein